MNLKSASHARGGSGQSLDVLLAALLAAAALASAAWWWSARRMPQVASSQDPWEHIQASYPLVALPEAPARPDDLVRTVTRANPFSPQRRQVPIPKGDGGQGSGQGTAVPEKPKFAYKGRVLLGSRERAVLEDVTTAKTHFLEVGQEVAGFKLLDIDEKRVVLSDTQTQEEIVVNLTPVVPVGISGASAGQAGSP